MSKYAILFLFITSLVACTGNDDQNTLLKQSPYNVLTDSIKQQPANSELYYRRGVLLYQNDQKNLAALDLRKAWQLHPKEEYALSLTTLLREKNADSAIVFLQKAIDQFPNSISLHVGLARGYQQKGDLFEAIKILDQMLAAIPNQIDALLLKSEIAKQLNNQTEAISSLEKAYSYAPFDKEIAYRLAFEYAETKNPKVLALADSLTKYDSIDAKAEPYYFKGVYFSNIGKSSEAIKSFNDAIQHDYYFLNAYINKGIVYYDLKQYQEALKTFQLAATISPSFDEAYYWLGKTQEILGDKQNAKLNYQRAYGLNKENVEAKKAADRL